MPFPRRPIAGVAIFLAFQSQAWHTDDETGHRPARAPPRQLVRAGAASRASPTGGIVRIVARAGQPDRAGAGAETVTLLNLRRPTPIDLAGWRLIDKSERTQALAGRIDAGATRVVAVAPPLALGNKGGTITLVDDRGLKVDGIAYTKDDAAADGWTIVF